MTAHLHKNLCYLMGIVLLITFAGTAKAQSKMTIKTALSQKQVIIGMTGSDEATIDWGDGKSDHVLLQSETKYYHDYDVDLSDDPYPWVENMPSYTITISEEHVTGLYLEGCLDSPGNSYDDNDRDIRCLELDVSKNIALMKLNCWDTALTTLDVSKNTALITLDCGFNSLTDIDVSNNTALKDLSCEENLMENLDISKNILLQKLDCSHNQLTNLDVSNHTELYFLSCDYNKLTNLDVSHNTELQDLYCSHNDLSEIALNMLFGTLPLYKRITHEGTDGGGYRYINAENNPGAKSCDTSIAENKEWEVVR